MKMRANKPTFKSQSQGANLMCIRQMIRHRPFLCIVFSGQPQITMEALCPAFFVSSDHAF